MIIKTEYKEMIKRTLKRVVNKGWNSCNPFNDGKTAKKAKLDMRELTGIAGILQRQEKTPFLNLFLLAFQNERLYDFTNRFLMDN